MVAFWHAPLSEKPCTPWVESRESCRWLTTVDGEPLGAAALSSTPQILDPTARLDFGATEARPAEARAGPEPDQSLQRSGRGKTRVGETVERSLRFNSLRSLRRRNGSIQTSEESSQEIRPKISCKPASALKSSRDTATRIA